MATFDDGTVTHFGTSVDGTYPFHKDAIKRYNYMKRHIRDLATGDVRRAGFLSWYILWGFPSIDASVKVYNEWLERDDSKIPTDMDLYQKLSPRLYVKRMNESQLPPWIQIRW